MRPFPFPILAMFSLFPETESLLTGYIIRSKGGIEKTADGPDLVYSKAVSGPKTHLIADFFDQRQTSIIAIHTPVNVYKRNIPTHVAGNEYFLAPYIKYLLSQKKSAYRNSSCSQ